jgi:hypothetical protein
MAGEIFFLDSWTPDVSVSLIMGIGLDWYQKRIVGGLRETCAVRYRLDERDEGKVQIAKCKGKKLRVV